MNPPKKSRYCVSQADVKPGEACFFPAEMQHVFIATTPRAKVMVIYAPPYGEDPKKAIRNG